MSASEEDVAALVFLALQPGTPPPVRAACVLALEEHEEKLDLQRKRSEWWSAKMTTRVPVLSGGDGRDRGSRRLRP